MSIVSLLCITGLTELVTEAAAAPSQTNDKALGSVIKGVSLPTLGGGQLTEDSLTGKVILVVNVASRCGYTRQYEGLQKLHEAYGPRGLVVLGVPCNQFGAQEPGSPEEIKAFTQTRYNVTFPLLAKQNVNGPNRSEFMTRLSNQSMESRDVGWNFEKFLVSRSGRVIGRYRSGVDPESETLTQAIEGALAESQKAL